MEGRGRKVKGARCLNPPLIISLPGVSRTARENLKLARAEGGVGIEKGQGVLKTEPAPDDKSTMYFLRQLWRRQWLAHQVSAVFQNSFYFCH